MKIASMGPRSCERGNVGSEARLRLIYRFASMGPRSCERGNLFLLTRNAFRASSRFNGAALVRARKSGDPSSGGNGSSSLQWGRARASAEIQVAAQPNPAVKGFNGAALVRARKWPGCKQLGLRRRNNRFRAAAIFNLLT